MSGNVVVVTMELSEARATALALFIKRLTLDLFEAACAPAKKSAVY